MELISLVLTLRPSKASNPEHPLPERPLPRWWGRAAQALLLDAIRDVDAGLAAELHDPESEARPYTVSTLMGPAARERLEPGQDYRLRLTAIRGDVAERLGAATRAGGKLAPGVPVELDHWPFQIKRVEPDMSVEEHAATGDPPKWTGRTSYQALSSPFLLASETPARRVSFLFSSPTTFKSQGRHVPVPMPGLVFGSLLNRWNEFAPVAFPEEVKQYADECLAVSRYQLSSRVAEVKAGGRRMGGVGQATFTTLNYDRYWMSLIHTLARFALYSGVGAGTTMGLGQCRMLEDRE